MLSVLAARESIECCICITIHNISDRYVLRACTSKFVTESARGMNCCTCQSFSSKFNIREIFYHEYEHGHLQLSGGRITWKVPTGRRDGNVSSALDAFNDLPSPFSTVANLTSAFAAVGLSKDQMVTLSGATSSSFPCFLVFNPTSLYEHICLGTGKESNQGAERDCSFKEFHDDRLEVDIKIYLVSILHIFSVGGNICDEEI